MATSPSDDELDVRPTPTREEAAAIATAIGAYLSDEDGSEDRTAQPSGWKTAARLEAVADAPPRGYGRGLADAWVASHRFDV